jgi:hypothetical protein
MNKNEEYQKWYDSRPKSIQKLLDEYRPYLMRKKVLVEEQIYTLIGFSELKSGDGKTITQTAILTQEDITTKEGHRKASSEDGHIHVPVEWMRVIRRKGH